MAAASTAETVGPDRETGSAHRNGGGRGEFGVTGCAGRLLRTRAGLWAVRQVACGLMGIQET
jgi:hypothetical protein